MLSTHCKRAAKATTRNNKTTGWKSVPKQKKRLHETSPEQQQQTQMIAQTTAARIQHSFGILSKPQMQQAIPALIFVAV